MDAWPTCLPQRNKTTTVHLRVPQWQSKVPGILSFFHSFYPEFELWLSFLPETRIKTLILSKHMIGRPFLIFSREYILTWWIFQSMIHCNLHFQCVFHQKEQKTFNLSTLLLGLAPGKFQYFGIIKLQTKRYKNSGIFHSRKRNKAQEYPWIYSFFWQLSISMGHNCPVLFAFSLPGCMIPMPRAWLTDLRSMSPRFHGWSDVLSPSMRGKILLRMMLFEKFMAIKIWKKHIFLGIIYIWYW